MKLNLTNFVPFQYNRQVIQKILTDIQNQINGISEGVLANKHNAMTSAPTTGNYAVGDFVANSAISELGTAGNKYIITGWTCTATSPLTFVQTRCLTGN